MDQPGQFAELRGFFAAFEWVNSKSDHGYTFSIDAVTANDGSHEQLTQAQFRIWEPTELQLVPLTNPRTIVRDSTLKWLRSYLTDTAPYRMTAPNATFSLDSDAFDDEFAATFMDRLECDGKISQGYRIQFRTDGFYECAWDDFLLLTGRWAVFLHFGVSD